MLIINLYSVVKKSVISRFHSDNIFTTLLWSLLILWGFILYFPSLKLSFSLLDDGLMVKNARLIYTSVTNWDWGGVVGIIFEPGEGRVRPAYWIVESIFSWLAGYNSSLIHGLRLSLLGLSSFLINKILKEINIKATWRMTAIFVYITNVQNFENYYRLGPVEPFLVLYLLILLYISFFYRKQGVQLYFWSLFAIALGVFTKENFFLVCLSLLPITVLTRLTKNINLTKRLFATAGLSVIFGLIIFKIRSVYPTGGVYASNYIISFGQIVANFRTYVKELVFSQTPLPEIAIIYFAYFWYKFFQTGNWKMKLEEIFYVSLWILAVTQLAVLTPWKFVLGRYLALVNVSLVIIYAISLNNIISILNRKIPAKYKTFKAIGTLVISVAILATFLVRNVFEDANYQIWQKTDSEISRETVNAIAATVGKNQTVFTNYKRGDANIEIFLETGWHLEEFHGRDDIRFEYIDSDNLCTSRERYIFDRTSDRFFDPKALEDKNIFAAVEQGDAVYEPINYGVVAKSLYYRTKLDSWSDQHIQEWGVYKQKANTCIKKEDLI